MKHKLVIFKLEQFSISSQLKEQSYSSEFQAFVVGILAIKDVDSGLKKTSHFGYAAARPT